MLKFIKKLIDKLINNKEVKYSIVKKDGSLYPFSESDASKISDTLIIKKKFNLMKKYNIKVILK